MPTAAVPTVPPQTVIELDVLQVVRRRVGPPTAIVRVRLPDGTARIGSAADGGPRAATLRTAAELPATEHTVAIRRAPERGPGGVAAVVRLRATSGGPVFHGEATAGDVVVAAASAYLRALAALAAETGVVRPAMPARIASRRPAPAVVLSD